MHLQKTSRRRSSCSAKNLLIFGGIACLALTFTSCATPEGELSRVAKDWCMTIRASQVIPVYPLSEDIQPGDIYIVTTPIPDQVALWESKGFLPLDRLVARMPPTNYSAFYDDYYGTKNKGPLPHNWQFPAGPSTPVTNATDTAWSLAPRVAFPTYSFKIQKGGGINMALPIQGVPVALTALGAKSATASVVLKNAFTYGIDEGSFDLQVRSWARKNQGYLQRFAPSASPRSDGSQYSYVRVVTRVYLVSQVNVTVTSDDAYSAQASGGEPKPVNNILLGQSTTNVPAATANIAAAEEAVTNSAGQDIKVPSGTTNITQLASTVLPGGTIRIAAASSRSVSMDEHFDRPLVVGYLALEYPIEPRGVISHDPYATLAMVNGHAPPDVKVFSGAAAARRQAEIDLNP